MNRDFFLLPTPEVARRLLGCELLVRSPEGATGGVIVETEAYLGAEDPAAHSFRGETKRTRSLFGHPGHAYVYFIYGMHTALNVVAAPVGVGHAVLIRALEPTVGVELMKARRGRDSLTDLCSGPGKLAQALGVTLADDGADLVAGERFVLKPAGIVTAVTASPRTGISRAVDLPYRFYLTDSPFVSGIKKRPA